MAVCFTTRGKEGDSTHREWRQRSTDATLSLSFTLSALGTTPPTTMKRFMTRIWWWPRIDDDIDKFVENCPECQVHKDGGDAGDTPLHFRVPMLPYRVVCADHFKFGNHHYLAIVDAFSLYANVEYAGDKENLTEHETAMIFGKVFAENDWPILVVTDNAPCFSKAFTACLAYCNVAHKTSVRKAAWSNGQAEKIVGEAKDMLQKMRLKRSAKMWTSTGKTQPC